MKKEMKQNKMRKYEAAFFLSVFGLLAVCGVLLLALPQKKYSGQENRYLTTFAPVTFSGFLQGSVQKNLTDAANDQFFYRDGWMRAATKLQKSFGMRDVGGVYFGADGYYFTRELDSSISQVRYENNLRVLTQFASGANAPVTFLPAPSAGTILGQKLPRHAVLYDADAMYAQAASLLGDVTLLDVRPLLTEAAAKSQVYFKTDHHWTMYGAYEAYAAYCKSVGANPQPLRAFAPECVSTQFYGTLYAKAPLAEAVPDALFLPKRLPEASLVITGGGDAKNTAAFADGQPHARIYDTEKLAGKDKYGVYFGGNFARIDITGNGRTDKKLLVIKDSYANSVVPFLMADYAQITMLDLRYYNGCVQQLLQEYSPDEILVLYALTGFAGDMHLHKLLNAG